MINKYLSNNKTIFSNGETLENRLEWVEKGRKDAHQIKVSHNHTHTHTDWLSTVQLIYLSEFKTLLVN